MHFQLDLSAEVSSRNWSFVQSVGFFHLRSRQRAEPLIFLFSSSRMAPHPLGQLMQVVLGLVSCGWYRPAGQSSHFFIPLDKAILPLEQIAQDVDPKELVFPAGQGSQLRRLLSSVTPLVPSGHGEDSLHTPSLEQFVACQPGAMATKDTPPAEIVPAFGL